ncbi:hypothetical protein EFL57_06345 [Weissella confusa]|uniref:hypothetical protein n=1 Tax=Weissella confusa TaxID=1583 RepID=UPI00223A6965|nr:hypothetical protein [Weissella confusa]MCT0010068.1 hypothetical protein [Weissella confusa]
MRQWWQSKLILGVGMVGMLLYVLQSVIATIIWPAYRMVAYPLAILMAPDSQYATAFKGLQLIAGLLIAVSLAALWRYSRYKDYTDLVKTVQQLILVWLAGVLLNFIWPLNSIVEAVLRPAVSARNIVFGLLIILLGWTIWRVGSAAQIHDMTTLANGLKLFAILYVLFNFLEFAVTLIGWQLSGFFDVLAIDVLAVAMGYISWYFMRLAE